MADRGPQQVQVHSQYGQKPGGPFGQQTRGGVFGGEHSQGPSAGKVLAVMALLPVGGTLLFLAGLTFVGTMIGLALSTPVFVIFSPVLVPAALTIGLAVAGFLTSGAFGVTGLSSLSWVFNYFRRTSVPDQLDYAKRRAQDMVGFAGQKVKDVGQEVQTKVGTEGKRA